MRTHTVRRPSDGYVGLVLSAGASTRFSAGAKGVADADGQPAIVRLLRVLRSVGVERCGVVVGAHRNELEPLARSEGAETIVHAGWRAGRTGSIQAGLEWAQASDGVVLCPVDHPFVAPATIGRLLEVARSDPVALWVGPTYRGRGGHPIVIKSAAFPSILDLGADEPLHRVPPRLGVQVRRVEVRDVGVLSGTDTPEEYERARYEHAQSVGGLWTVG